MENKQEIDLIELLLLFLNKVKKNMYFFLLILSSIVILGIILASIKKKTYSVELLAESLVKNEIIYKLVEEINMQNNKTRFISSKINSISFTKKLNDLNDSKKEKPLLFMNLVLNDTTQFGEIPKRVSASINNVPFVLEIVSQKKEEINKTISYYSNEIVKIEKFQNSILNQNESNALSINSDLMSSALVSMKIKRNKLIGQLEKLCSFQFIPKSFVSFKLISSFKKDVFLFVLLGLFFASFLVIIKKD